MHGAFPELAATGCVRAEHAYSGTSCGSLTLEVGKSPTEVTRGRHVPGSLPSAICEFDSSSSCSWSLNRAVLETGGNIVSRTKERAPDPLLVPALLARATPSIC
eukprot:scaffold38347_cov43-Phaeocystis_antarctica.AAC.2